MVSSSSEGLRCCNCAGGCCDLELEAVLDMAVLEPGRRVLRILSQAADVSLNPTSPIITFAVSAFFTVKRVGTAAHSTVRLLRCTLYDSMFACMGARGVAR